MPNNNYDWDDETEPAKQSKRDAANKFLRKTQEDLTLRDNVVADRGEARRQFQSIGGIGVPDDVEVICLEPEPNKLAKLMVFALLKVDEPPVVEPWRACWLAARIPNDPEWHEAANRFLLQTQPDSTLRHNVLTNRTTAHDQFALIGGIPLPNDVEVICREPERKKLARLVVFKLLPRDLYKDCWLAAWQPYR